MRFTLASLALALMAQCIAVACGGLAEDDFCAVARCGPDAFCDPTLSACVAERVDYQGVVHLFVGGGQRARCGAAGITDTSAGGLGPRCESCQGRD